MTDTLPPVLPPQRHGCLTALLIFMLVANSATFLYYVFAGARVFAAFPRAPSWIVYLFAGGSVLNIFLAVSVFRWKKWAFYAFCVVAVVTFLVNLSIGVPIISAVLGLLGPALLYGVLQIGESGKGWPHLK